MTDSAVQTRESVPNQIMTLFENYKGWQRYWYVLHYSAGVVAVVAGGLATASGAKSGPEFIQLYTWIWGLLATLMSGVVTFLGPLQKAEAYKHAYYVLSSAITRFEARQVSMDVLLDEYDRAKSIVLQGDPKAAKK